MDYLKYNLKTNGHLFYLSKLLKILILDCNIILVKKFIIKTAATKKESCLYLSQHIRLLMNFRTKKSNLFK